MVEAILKKRIEEIGRAIDVYAKAYIRIEQLQQAEALKGADQLIPIGDQKTGAIGEFYAATYLRAKHPSANVVLKPPNNHQVDIDLIESGETTRVQVKTVSRHSQTRTISPIHGGYHELHLILLDEKLRVVNYWITEDVIIGQSLRMPDPQRDKPGSAKLTGRIEVTDEALTFLQRLGC